MLQRARHHQPRSGARIEAELRRRRDGDADGSSRRGVEAVACRRDVVPEHLVEEEIVVAIVPLRHWPHESAPVVPVQPIPAHGQVLRSVHERSGDEAGGGEDSGEAHGASRRHATLLGGEGEREEEKKRDEELR